jgi:antitoxin component of MazEF toxin-antitoxin module
MTATIQKWGNSLALRIPLAVAKKISLDDLLSQVTPENLHPATEWGADVGREFM